MTAQISPLHNITIELHTKYSSEVVSQMAQLTINQPALIEQFLLQEKYIELIEYSTHLAKLTEKGEKAKELGGHQQYLGWKKKEDNKSTWTEFPKRYWYWVSLTTLVIGWFGNVLKDKIQQQPTRTSQPAPIQSKPTILIVHDTVCIEKIDSHTLKAPIHKGNKIK